MNDLRCGWLWRWHLDIHVSLIVGHARVGKVCSITQYKCYVTIPIYYYWNKFTVYFCHIHCDVDIFLYKRVWNCGILFKCKVLSVSAKWVQQCYSPHIGKSYQTLFEKSLELLTILHICKWLKMVNLCWAKSDFKLKSESLHLCIILSVVFSQLWALHLCWPSVIHINCWVVKIVKSTAFALEFHSLPCNRWYNNLAKKPNKMFAIYWCSNSVIGHPRSWLVFAP